MPENMPDQPQKEADSTKEHQIASGSTIPPKPDLPGKNKKQGMMLLHHYYEDNAPAILSCFKELGDKKTREDWGFSSSGWTMFKRRHGLPMGKPRGKGVKRVKEAAAPPVPPPPPKLDKSIVKTAEELAARAVPPQPPPVPAKPADAITELPPASTEKVLSDDRNQSNTFTTNLNVLIDESAIDAAIAAAKQKIERLVQLKAAGLPKFRWYWILFPGVLKKWLEIYEKLMLG